jgi:hypothetical protein
LMEFPEPIALSAGTRHIDRYRRCIQESPPTRNNLKSTSPKKALRTVSVQPISDRVANCDRIFPFAIAKAVTAPWSRIAFRRFFSPWPSVYLCHHISHG